MRSPDSMGAACPTSIATDQAAINSDSRRLPRIAGRVSAMADQARAGCRSAGGVRPRSLRALDQPVVDLLVPPRVVEQVEMVEPADPVHAVGREGQPVV